MLASLFTPDHDRHDGVRPIQIHLLRALYFLMAALVAPDAWSTIARHQGAWDHTRAVAWCVWAAYPTMAALGLLRPLRMLPIVVFMIFYKSLWLAVVAYPLWKAGTLVGSPAEEMARVFMWAPLFAVVVPWGYFVREFVLPAKRARVRDGRAPARGSGPRAPEIPLESTPEIA